MYSIHLSIFKARNVFKLLANIDRQDFVKIQNFDGYDVIMT